MSVIRIRSKLGKYRIDRRITEGGFATVYEARDTVSGICVALKVPHPSLVNKEMLEAFRKEVRLTAQLDHQNILPIKDAGTIDGIFYVATPLGVETLADRLQRRLATKTLATFAAQIIDAVAYAHRRRIMHCDIKPENFILFPENRLRLADFGIAKVALRTMPASGSGTIGYVAPEQAMGKPSFRSDVFSTGLVLYRMLSGCLPEWPYHWPMIGCDRVERVFHPGLVKLVRRALEVDSRKRFADAVAMQRTFKRLPHFVNNRTTSKRAKKARNRITWRTMRWREFSRAYRTVIGVRHECPSCGGPTAEEMQGCPWCGSRRRARKQATRFPKHCPRCKRGVKSDWRFCPWCYGRAISSNKHYRYTDERYVGQCRNASCVDKLLMPFMRYCPWCRRKVARAWRIAGSKDRCPNCSWGVLPDYWDYCPWCVKRLPRGT
ncbi:MAG: serine/threonine-protein kinase [Phycisphaerae bacterium]